MVRFSKTIQRAIPQKIRRSASMLKCETTPFCYTPKYATIVLRSSGALKHWLVSSVASLAGSLVWGAAASSKLTTRSTLLNSYYPANTHTWDPCGYHMGCFLGPKWESHMGPIRFCQRGPYGYHMGYIWGSHINPIWDPCATRK